MVKEIDLIKEIRQYCDYAIAHYNNPIGYPVSKEQSINLWEHLCGYLDARKEEIFYTRGKDIE